MSYFGRHREISARKASMPAASIFAHCAAVNRIERCSSFASGGVGGRPIGFLCCSMAIVYVIHKVLAMRHLLNHNNYTDNAPEKTMEQQQKTPEATMLRDAGCRTEWSVKLADGREYFANTYPSSELVYVENAKGRQIHSRAIDMEVRTAIAQATATKDTP